MHVHGLRVRVAVLVSLLVLVCVGVAFVAVYREASSQLSRRADQDLRQDMDALVHAATAGPRGRRAVEDRVRSFLDNPPFRPTNHIAYLVVGASAISNQPELLGLTQPESGENRAVQTSENRAGRTFMGARPGASEQVLPDAGRFRVLVRPITLSGGQVARLGIGEPTSAIDRAKASVLAAFLLAGAVATLAALLGGILVASRITSPLRRMAAVASSVDAGDLGGRMEVPARRDEVGILAESFNHMLDRLEGAFELQSAFVADASHELRTPLTVIRGQLEVLAREENPTREEIRRVEGLVRMEMLRMERLVEDLLLLAQAGTDGFLRPAEIDLSLFLRDLVRGHASTSARDLRLAGVSPATVYADPDRLAQALRNLMNNAIAHTTRDGRIEVSAHVTGDLLTLAVDDDGPGIPRDERAAIFERFHRLDAGRSREAGGAGLGLAIVQAIAEAHGGRARAEASSLGGARMVIEIPLGKPRRVAVRTDRRTRA